MSLLIWLPLTKDLQTYGVQHSEVTATGATYNANGKLGGCYYFNTTPNYLLGTQTFISNNIGDFTFSCWAKFTVSGGTRTLFSCRTNVDSLGITIFASCGGVWYIDDGVRWQITPSTSINTNTWYHICIIRKKGVGKYLYINGELDSSTTTTGTPTGVNTVNYAIGACHQNTTTIRENQFYGYLNDVRFYDHALSVAEIKDISKGLCLHYKLDDFYGADNLIVNGYGELGTENWNNTSASYISTTEIPPDHSEIKASFYNGNSAKEYIPITTSHSYTISGYIKAMSGRTGNTYPSIFPYDIDKNFIDNQKSQAGFDANTLTTLRLPLHKGDTVIYATDLSKWRVDTTTHYYFAAIFGYKNSLGETYDDLIYTRDSVSFGSQTDKSNIDKTNNTITLKAAFTGEDRPAGTSICQAAAGSTYYYPWGGINYSTIQDWTFKTVTFKPSTVARLKAAAYWRWSTYGGTYIAGNRIVDNTLTTTEVVDSSGYGNHGTKSGNISVSYDSPRYDVDTVFDGSTGYINIVSDIFPPVLNGDFTISVWIYNNDVGDRSIFFGNWNLTGAFFGFEKTVAEKVRFYWNGSPDITFGNSIVTANAFSLVTVTRSGNTVKCYINGILKDTSTSTLNGSVPATATNFRIASDGRTGATRFKGQMSDFRIYATALSAEDVLALYNVGARVFKNGMMAGYELKEGE